MEVDSQFREKIYVLIAQVPAGQVTTYGDLAGLAGHANAPRIVGGIAHQGSSELPWHRLVNRFGGLAAGYHGGREEQQRLLEAEGVECVDFIVKEFNQRRWQAGYEK
jgi:methylated-DNA-protein-cysteine methyltransferase related protein